MPGSRPRAVVASRASQRPRGRLGQVAQTRALVRTLQFKLVGMSKRSASWHRSTIHLQCVAWQSSLWELLPRLPGGGGRLLVAYAHPSNGAGNRLSGLRASLALAQESNRLLLIRFAGDGQESAFLEPPTARHNWSQTAPEYGIATGADGRVADVWGSAQRWGPKRKVSWLPRGGWRLRRFADDGTLPNNDRTRTCVPLLRSPFPRNADNRADVERFREVARSRAPVVVIHELFHDALQPLVRQEQYYKLAHEQYRTLFGPKPGFVAAMCAHLRRVQLHRTQHWISVQLRRTQQAHVDEAMTTAAVGAAGPEPALSSREQRGVRSAVQCGLAARGAACRRGDKALCKSPIYLTSNSFRAIRLGARLLGADARHAPSAKFGHHGSPRSSYLPALLEMGVVSASAIVVASAGSSFALEAASMGGKPAIVRDFGLFTTPTEDMRRDALQGDCAAPPPLAGRTSVLLPEGACEAGGQAQGG